MKFSLAPYLAHFYQLFPDIKELPPWEITNQAPQIIENLLAQLSPSFKITTNNIAIHPSAIIEKGVVMKGPLVISENCFIGAHAYLRGGVFLGPGGRIGPGCEIKSTFLMEQSSIAHFNFIGDSLIGSDVNFEAGAVIANHFNERADKRIRALVNGTIVDTGMEKFGALVGDGARIGANAVLSPGTILEKKTIVKRLELIEQV